MKKKKKIEKLQRKLEKKKQTIESQQRLITSLQTDIRTLVHNPNSYRATEISTIVRLEDDMFKMIEFLVFTQRSTRSTRSTGGILGQVVDPMPDFKESSYDRED